MAELDDETMTAPVLTPTESMAYPQIEVLVVRRPDGAPPRVGFPACGTDIPEEFDESLPEQGEHTEELLREAGYDADEINWLFETGAIA